MKKIKLFFIFLLLTICISGCINKKEDVLKLKSDDEFTTIIQDLIDEPIEFVETAELDYSIGEKQKCYKFLLKDRNIEFTAYQAICKYEPPLLSINEKINDYYFHVINYDDYFKQIKNCNNQNLSKLLEKYNLEQDDNYERIIISEINDSNIDNLYSFLIEAQELCNYKNKNNVAYRECFYVYINLEGIDLDDSIKERENNIMFLRNFNIINFNEEFDNKEKFTKEINNSYSKNIEYLKK